MPPLSKCDRGDIVETKIDGELVTGYVIHDVGGLRLGGSKRGKATGKRDDSSTRQHPGLTLIQPLTDGIRGGIDDRAVWLDIHALDPKERDPDPICTVVRSAASMRRPSAADEGSNTGDPVLGGFRSIRLV